MKMKKKIVPKTERYCTDWRDMNLVLPKGYHQCKFILNCVEMYSGITPLSNLLNI